MQSLPVSSAHPFFRLSVALVASLVTLCLVYVAQYGFGLVPCELCLAQRAPYGVAILLSAFGVWWHAKKRERPAYARWLVPAVGLVFLVGAGIAAYHSAIERHWIAGPTACTGPAGGPGQTSEDFLKRIESAPIVACDQPAWDFNGVTMASLNVFWSLALAGFMLWPRHGGGNHA